MAQQLIQPLKSAVKLKKKKKKNQCSLPTKHCSISIFRVFSIKIQSWTKKLVHTPYKTIVIMSDLKTIQIHRKEDYKMKNKILQEDITAQIYINNNYLVLVFTLHTTRDLFKILKPTNNLVKFHHKVNIPIPKPIRK